MTKESLLDRALRLNNENPQSPLPIERCDNCNGTIWRQDNLFQCPDCGTLSTAFGGTFSGLSKPSKDFVDSVNKVRHY